MTTENETKPTRRIPAIFDFDAIGQRMSVAREHQAPAVEITSPDPAIEIAREWRATNREASLAWQAAETIRLQLPPKAQDRYVYPLDANGKSHYGYLPGRWVDDPEQTEQHLRKYCEMFGASFEQAVADIREVGDIHAASGFAVAAEKAEMLEQECREITDELLEVRARTPLGFLSQLAALRIAGKVDDEIYGLVLAGVRVLRRAPQCGADADILSLFREWMTALRHAEAIDSGVDEDGFNKACRVARDIAKTIFGLPAEGARGLAIKAFLMHRDAFIFGRRDGDPCTLGGGPDDSGEVEWDSFASILEDAASFVPELAPLSQSVTKQT